MEQVSSESQLGQDGKTRTSSSMTEHNGIVEAWVSFWLVNADTLIGTSFDLVRDAQGVVKQIVTKTLDFGEGVSEVAFGGLRKLNERGDALFSKCLHEGEKALRASVGAARLVTRSATNLTSDATVSLIGRRANAVA